MWLDALLVSGLLGAGYVLGRLHARRLVDREGAFAALANLPEWELRARDLERRAYRIARRHGRFFWFAWELKSDVTSLHHAADMERVRGRQRDANARGTGG